MYQFSQRIGYLAATQSFHEETDVIMLTTNMIRKDLSSHHQYDAGLALDGLGCFMTPDLARDLANDVLTLVSKVVYSDFCKGLFTIFGFYVSVQGVLFLLTPSSLPKSVL